MGTMGAVPVEPSRGAPLAEKLLFSFILFIGLWLVACCWKYMRNSQRAALSDDGDRRFYTYKKVSTSERL